MVPGVDSVPSDEVDRVPCNTVRGNQERTGTGSHTQHYGFSFYAVNMPLLNCTFSYAHGRDVVTIFRVNPPLVLHVSEEFEDEGPGEGLLIEIEGSDVCLGIRVGIGDAYSKRCGDQ